MWLLEGAGYPLARTSLDAQPAALALLLDDLVGNQLATDAGRTELLRDVLLVLLAEVAQCAEDRVRSGFTQAAQRSRLDRLRQVLQRVEVSGMGIPRSNPDENEAMNS